MLRSQSQFLAFTAALGLAGATLLPSTSDAGTPSAATSTISVQPPAFMPCQYVVHPQGIWDCFTIGVTVRDAAGVIQVGCPTTITLTPLTGLVGFCSGANPQTGVTGGSGMMAALFCKMCGYGTFSATVVSGGVTLGTLGPYTMTSPDLGGPVIFGGICAPAPSGFSVVDLAIWASGLSPGYQLYSDFNCDGEVGVLDLALFATIFNSGC